MKRINSAQATLFLKIAAVISLSFVITDPLIASPARAMSLPDPDKLFYQPLSFTQPKPDRVILNNGLVLYILENRELPLIKISAVIRTGSMYDPPGKEGLAELTGSVMKTGGILGMSGKVVDETLEQMAASLHFSIDRDSGVFSLSVLSKDVEEGLDIFSRMLMKPVFEDTKLRLAKDLKIGELRRISDQPQKLAFREFGRLIHAGSPRGRLATQNSIGSIHRDDLIRCHDLFYRPERVMISISGDISKKEAEAVINRFFSMWASGDEKVDVPAIPHLEEGGIYVLAKDIPQSVIIFGWIAPSKVDAEFFPFEVVDFIVGNGGSRSKIFQEIRTDRGLAYSTGSFYNTKSEYGLFGTYAITKAESTLEVMASIRRIIGDIGLKTIPPKELQEAKNALLNRFIFSFTSAEKIVVQRMMIEYDKLPDGYLNTYRSKVSTVTANDVKKAAGCLDLEKAVILIVGNNTVIKEVSGFFAKVTLIGDSY